MIRPTLKKKKDDPISFEGQHDLPGDIQVLLARTKSYIPCPGFFEFRQAIRCITESLTYGQDMHHLDGCARFKEKEELRICSMLQPARIVVSVKKSSLW
jgi:hypothetical protein